VITRVKAAQWATFVYFGLNGFVMGPGSCTSRPSSIGLGSRLTHLMPLARTFPLPAGLCAIAVLTAAIARPDSATSKATADEPPRSSAEDRALIADRNL
jgi:hypothetical protein